MGFSGSGGGGSTNISGLSDVALNNPVKDDMLTYDTTSTKWKNAPVASANGATVGWVRGIFVDDPEDIPPGTPADTLIIVREP